MNGSFSKMHSTAAITIVALFASPLTAAIKWVPGHYILVYKGAPQSSFDKAIDAPNVKGVQVRYIWNHLETAKGRYDFSQIKSDLALLRSHGKYLIIQVEDKAMNADAPYAPDYILDEPEYEGGVYNMKPGGWAPRYWVPAVMDRICALYTALGAELDNDPNVAAINAQETALDNSGTDDRNATGYTAIKYVAALKRAQSALKTAFPNTVTLQYMNYFRRHDGRWRSGDARGSRAL